MDVRIYEGEEIRITAIDRFGKEFHSFVSFEQVVDSGTVIIDGLSEAEIAELENNKKIMAIKQYRLRTGCPLKDAKVAIEAWIERNRCCKQFPYCDHEKAKSLEGLDINLLKSKSIGDLSLTWSYPAVITEDQAKALQEKAGYRTSVYGFYSFQTVGGESRWASNRYGDLE